MTEHDILDGGIAALSEDTEDGFLVNGVALGEGDVTEGMSGKRTRWTPEALQDLADQLPGKPITENFGEGHVGAERTENGLEVNPNVPLRSKLGEVTDAKYVEGLGTLWQGEIRDAEMAAKVEQGLAEVSPVVARDLEEVEPGLFEATAVNGVRDLGLVSNGAAPSNSIEPGAAAAMTAEALTAAMSSNMSDEQRRAKYAAKSDHDDDYNAGKEMAEQMSPDQWTEFVDSISREDQHWSGALDAVSRAQSTLQTLMFHLAEHDGDMHGGEAMSEALNSIETTGAESPADGSKHMDTDDITDAEFELLAASRQMDSPAVIEEEDAERLPEADELLAAADETDSPIVVDGSEYEALKDNTETVRNVLEEALCERTDLRESTVEALSFEALCGEFENEEGEFAPEALTQTPETGDVSEESDVEALSDDDKGRIEEIDQKIAALGNVLPSERVEALQSEACELADVEEYGEIEVLN